MKTIKQALKDEVHYPLSDGFVENVMLRRGFEEEDIFTQDVALSSAYIGAVADCLSSLLHSIAFSEADKSVSALSDKDKERIAYRANQLYKQIGEPVIEYNKPKVYIGL